MNVVSIRCSEEEEAVGAAACAIERLSMWGAVAPTEKKGKQKGVSEDSVCRHRRPFCVCYDDPIERQRQGPI